jgi:hypothetical protein
VLKAETMPVDEVDRPDGERAEAPVSDRRPAPGWHTGFFWWSVAFYLGATAVLVGSAMVRTDGHFTYALDDAAIHLSMGDALAHHGTWGVVPGEFESASSSPLYTLLLAALQLVVPTGREFLPLVVNLVAGVWALAILAANQTMLRPGRRRWLDVIGTVMVVALVLMLPVLAMVGMEHTLHLALVLAILTAFNRRRLGLATGRPWVPYALLAVAALIRFETLFLAVGLAVGLLVEAVPRLATPGSAPVWRERLRQGVLIGAVTAAPLVAFGLINVAFGQGLLPNSILAKTLAGEGNNDFGWQRYSFDRVLTGLLLVALVYLVVAWFGGPRRNVFAATAFTLTSGLHLTLASIGWWERYQAYLIGMGVYVALAIAAEVLPDHRRKVVPALALVALLLSPVKFEIFSQTPLAADNMYRDHVQPARFLDRYYDDEPIATGELGYISLAHDGPLTDLVGLGDYEVLQARLDERDDERYWADLARRRQFGVVAVYPVTLLFDTPEDWILIGSFELNQKRATSVSKEFQFWATTPDAGERLYENLQDFEPELPDEVDLELNELAPFRIAELRGD